MKKWILFAASALIIVLSSSYIIISIVNSGSMLLKLPYLSIPPDINENSKALGNAKTPDNDITSSPLVVIDPGHGGNDPGTSGNGVVEKDISLDVCMRLNKILIDSRINTLMTRSTDSFMEHKDRILLANEKNASLFISIHCDWFDNPSYGGTQTLYFPSKELKKGNLNEIEYAQIIQGELLKVTKVNDRGINDRPNLAVLKHAKMPSVLVELGFLSNKNDASLLASPEFRQKVAEGLSKGILKSLEKMNS